MEVLVELSVLLLALTIFSIAFTVAERKRAREAANDLRTRIEWLEGQLGALRGRLDPVEPRSVPKPVVQAPPAPVAARPVPPPLPAPPPPVTPSAPQAPRETMALEQRIGARWATWVGVVTLVVTMGLLLRWTFENHLIGPKGRVILGLSSGVALAIAGLVLHRRRILPYLSDGLAGGGLAILYLSLFAAGTLYKFLDAGAAFGAMSLVTLAGVAIAVACDRQAIAVLAVLGGLMTPILVTTVHPDERVLLAYLLVLDALVLGVARYRSWAGLNRLAWIGSVLLLSPVIAKPSPHPVARLALLSALGTLFLAVPLAQAWAERRRVQALDLGLVVGSASAYFSAVYVTLERWHPSLEGIWALAVGAVHVAVARAHKLRVPEDDPAVGLHLGLAVTFAAIAAPLAFDGPWVTMAWAVLGAVCVHMASRRVQSMATLVGGLAVLGLAVARAAALDVWWFHPSPPVWNAAFAVHLGVVLALIVAGWSAVRVREDLRSSLWFAAAGLLAILLWREPPGLWCGALLAAECVALAWLARVQRDPAFVYATPVLAGILFLRFWSLDATTLAGRVEGFDAGAFALRLAACGAVALAGRWLVASKATAEAEQLGGALRAFSGLALLVTLSLGWVLHERVAFDAARAASDADARQHLLWRIHVGLSILWTVYAAGALAWGIARSLPRVRWAALALLGIVVAKVFLVDLAELQAIYRILSFFVLGLVLLGVSYVYQRMRPAAGDGPG